MLTRIEHMVLDLRAFALRHIESRKRRAMPFPENREDHLGFRAAAEIERLHSVLQGIYQYGSDTLSGRTDGLDDRKWQRDGVREMTVAPDSL